MADPITALIVGKVVVAAIGTSVGAKAVARITQDGSGCPGDRDPHTQAQSPNVTTELQL